MCAKEAKNIGASDEGSPRPHPNRRRERTELTARHLMKDARPRPLDGVVIRIAQMIPPTRYEAKKTKCKMARVIGLIFESYL